jgi:hypothetical protein
MTAQPSRVGPRVGGGVEHPQMRNGVRETPFARGRAHPSVQRLDPSSCSQTWIRAAHSRRLNGGHRHARCPPPFPPASVIDEYPHLLP